MSDGDKLVGDLIDLVGIFREINLKHYSSKE